MAYPMNSFYNANEQIRVTRPNATVAATMPCPSNVVPCITLPATLAVELLLAAGEPVAVVEAMLEAVNEASLVAVPAAPVAEALVAEPSANVGFASVSTVGAADVTAA